MDPQILNYMSEYGENLLEPGKYNLINTTFNLIQIVIDEAIEVNAEDYQKFLITWMQAATMFGIAWGIGGILNEESRKLFDQYHKKVQIYDLNEFQTYFLTKDCQNYFSLIIRCGVATKITLRH